MPMVEFAAAGIAVIAALLVRRAGAQDISYRIALIRTQATVLVVIASKAKRSRILVASPAVLDRHDRFAVSR